MLFIVSVLQLKCPSSFTCSKLAVYATQVYSYAFACASQPGNVSYGDAMRFCILHRYVHDHMTVTVQTCFLADTIHCDE